MFKGRRGIIYAIILAGLLAVIWASYRSVSSTSTPTERPLSELLSALDAKQVTGGTFNADGDRVDWQDSGGHAYRTLYPVGYQLVDSFHTAGLPFSVQQSSSSNLLLSIVLPNVILFLVIGGFMWYVLRTAQRGKGPPPQA
ncbi:MAG: hypothetical protein M3077_06450 [Candidatus Dormibacteraeota bacterium]|nr:hypothetical protein [Candidatus Dormibacteraeota bacterium]